MPRPSAHFLILRLAFIWLALFACLDPAVASPSATSLALTTSASPILFGASVTLTAVVSPSAVTGSVTFYDGVAVLGTRPVVGGQAALSTALLPSGTRSLRAYYSGDSGHAASSSASITQTVNAVSGSLQAAAAYAGDANTTSLALGDFNGDGKIDIATPAGTAYMGNGDGTFQQARTIFSSSWASSSIAVGDFNGDGKTDLITTNTYVNSVSVILGNGDGSFQTPVTYALGFNASYVVVGDFNGDGKADLAVANGDYFNNNNVSILLGNGDGTFQGAVNYALGSHAASVAVADFNGDGKADLVTVNQNGNAAILLGNGDGTFRTAVTYFAGSGPQSVTTGDFNGDNKVDLAVANSTGNNVSILLGNGDGTFGTMVNYSAGNGPQSIVLGDFNGDGRIDLAVANNAGNNISVLAGNGDGTFQAAVSYATGSGPAYIVAAGLQGDGRADLVAAVSNGLSVLIASGPTPDLTISSMHTGNFTQGQTGATYTLTVTNAGTASSSGTVTATEVVPPGLFATAIGGNGWSCVLGTLTCTRTDALSAAASYPAIVVTINVAGNAAISVTNTANVSGGGETNTSNNSTTDPTTINSNGTGQTITFSALSNQTYGASPFAISASASSGLGVTFVSTTTGVCTLAGNTVTLASAGTCSITASQSGNGTFAPAPSVTQSFAVARASQAINFPALSGVTFGVAAFALNATASSGLPVSFASTTTNVCTIAGSTLTVVGAGSCSVNADQAGSTNYTAAATLTRSFSVAQAQAQAITINSSANPVLLGTPLTLTAVVSPSTVTGNIIFYDGVAVLGTRSLSGGQASLVTRLLPSGAHSIKAYYSGDGGHAAGTSTPIAQVVNAVAGTLQAAVGYAGTGGSAFALGDFNGDGKTDVATTAGVAYQGNGDGTFQAAVTIFSSNWSSSSISAGDINGDGKVDLVTTNTYVNTISVILGNGDGTFQAPVTYAVPVNSTSNALADFNGDGKLDVVVIDGDYFNSNGIGVLLGNGDGTLQPAVNYAISSHAVSIAVADFNGDGKADLATANQNGTVTILLGNGDGTFRTPVNYGAGSGPQSIVVGDFNGDGKADLAVANSGGNNVSVFLGNGDGTLRTAVNWTAGSGPGSVASSDFNGDGKADLVVANNGGNNISVLLGNGDGTFQVPVNYASGSGPAFIAAAALKGDGRADLLVLASAGLGVLLNVGATPDLTVSLVHSGNFAQGQTGATYSITVTNVGGAASSGTVTVTGTLPSGFTATAIGGTGWNCVLGTMTCTRADGLGQAASYAAINVTVNVAANTPASVTNTVTVSGGGETNAANSTGTEVIAITSNAVAQAITFSALSSQTLGASAFTISATASSGLTVAFASTTTGVCTVAGNLVTLVNAGTCSITASQAGNGAFAAATPVSQSFVVNPILQAIVFEAINDVTLSSPPFSITAAASSGLPVSFASTTTNTCTVTGSTVSVIAAGYCFITANQAGNTNYSAAAPVTRAFTIAAVQPPSVTLTSSASPILFGASVTLSAAVSPSAVTGSVTFYDGVAVLGTRPVVGGQAALSTTLLPSGTRSLRAYYSGDSGHAASSSASITQTVNAVSGSFQAAAAYAGDANTTSLAIGDFNGDGKIDIATPAGTAYMGNGDGTFQQARTIFSSSWASSSIAVGDFNGDGKTDLITTNTYVNSVSVILGNGDGSFQTPVTYAVGFNASYVVVGDFNGDGKADLAVANGDYFNNNNVSILLGNGDGTFQGAVNYPVGSHAASVAVADFNGDGKADLVTVNQNGNAAILLGNGDGTFRTAVTYFAGSGPQSVTTGDFNGDNKVDLAIANSTGNNVSILLGNGDGTFGTAVNYTAGNGPQSIVLGDFNGDGRIDLAVANNAGNNISVLAGNGDGTFQAAVSYATGSGPAYIVAAGLQGDGRADLVAAVSNGLRVLIASGPTPDLTVRSTHTGNFTQGQTGATYTLTVTNAGTAASSGIVTVVESPPPVLTVTAMAGSGWSCVLGTLTCTRSDALSAAASYPAIAVTVNVAGNAATSVTNTANVSGGGEANTSNNAGTDVTAINALTLSQTITFSAISDVVFGVAPFALSATASSGLAVSFASTTTGICSAAGSTVTVIATGVCSISAIQAGNATYNPAGAIVRSFVVSPASQAITFAPLSDITFQSTAVSLNASSSAGLPITFTSSTATVCTIAALAVNIVGTGTCSVTASQAGNTNYSAASPVARSFTVTAATQTITFPTLPDVNYGVSPFPVSATASSGLPVTFLSTTTGICTISGSTVTVNGAGTCSLSATQAGNSNYAMALAVQRSFNITASAALGISISHVGNPAQGQNGVTYSINISNVGSSPFANRVDVTVQFPQGLTATALTGTGWTCPDLTACNRNTTLPGDSSFPPILVTVSVDRNAATPLTVQASAAISGNSPVNASDITTVNAAFADNQSTDAFFNAVNLMREYHITDGCGGTPPMYCPNDSVTRAQMAIFIIRSITGGDSFSYSPTPYFEDVRADAFGFKWIQKMHELGITNGCGVATYCPNATVTRGQMAVFVVRTRFGAAADSSFSFPSTPYFADVPQDYPFYRWIQRMKFDQITNGCAADQYCPDNPVSRGQMATFIMRGGFNQLLPAGTPVISRVTPAITSVGQTTTVTILGQNTNFVQGMTQVDAGPGVTVGGISVVDSTTLTVQLTVAPNTAAGKRTILATTAAEQALLPNSLTLQ